MLGSRWVCSELVASLWRVCREFVLENGHFKDRVRLKCKFVLKTGDFKDELYTGLSCEVVG